MWGLQSILGQLDDMLETQVGPAHLSPFAAELESFACQIKRMIDGKMVLLASLTERPSDSMSSGATVSRHPECNHTVANRTTATRSFNPLHDQAHRLHLIMLLAHRRP